MTPVGTILKKRKMDYDEEKEEVYYKQQMPKLSTKPFSQKNRTIVLEWIFECVCYMKVQPFIFYSTVQLFDAFPKHKIPIHGLQLFGATCLFIFIKLYEIYPQDIECFVEICADLYKEEDFIQMEIFILKTFDYKIFGSNIYLKMKERKCEDEAFGFLAAISVVKEIPFDEEEEEKWIRDCVCAAKVITASATPFDMKEARVRQFAEHVDYLINMGLSSNAVFKKFPYLSNKNYLAILLNNP